MKFLSVGWVVLQVSTSDRDCRSVLMCFSILYAAFVCPVEVSCRGFNHILKSPPRLLQPVANHFNLLITF